MQSIEEMLSKLENADNTVKNEIENQLVSIGSKAVPELVNQLQVVRGIKRGVVAMTLIRIGDASGKGGYGAILVYIDSNGQKHEKEFSQGYSNTTNNQMELLAAITALEALKKPCKVTLTSDSKYLTDAINQKWLDGWIRNGWRTASKAPVKNIELWKRLIDCMKPHDITFVWVKGHAGHPYNERCDRLAVEAAKADNLLESPY